MNSVITIHCKVLVCSKYRECMKEESKGQKRCVYTSCKLGSRYHIVRVFRSFELANGLTKELPSRHHLSLESFLGVAPTLEYFERDCGIRAHRSFLTSSISAWCKHELILKMARCLHTCITYLYASGWRHARRRSKHVSSGQKPSTHVILG